MRTKSYLGRLCGTTSVLALSAVAMIGSSAQPAAAQTAIYGGGSTLMSLAARQVMDCYNGATLSGDNYTFSSTFNFATPTPGQLPVDASGNACGNATPLGREGLYAAVGSGSGTRAFISNDARQLLLGITGGFGLPATPPVFLDTVNFPTYPYPRLDFGAADSPLPGTLTTAALTNFVAQPWQDNNGVLATSSPTTPVTYDPAVTGLAIQLPTIEAPVAIGVNTNNANSVWQIQSALPSTSQAGGAVQLTTAQLCAIFSGQVTDWSSTAVIAAIDKTGAALTTETFSTANTNGTLAAQPYTTGSLPLQVVFRSDGSGTSFILTNYLANSCPQLDKTGSLNYKAIFTGVGATYASTVVTIVSPEGAASTTTTIAAKTNPATANLPSTTFATLIANIKAVTGVDVTTTANPWLGANGSGNVAQGIGNANDPTTANRAGRIGYISADFSQPYSSATTAPLSASLQDENLRSQGVYHPGDNGKTFIAPTPASADLSFTGLTAPQPDPITGNYTATYPEWNVYAHVHPSGTIVGGVNVSFKSQLGVPVVAGAYPLTGTTFMYLYSCYNTANAPTRVTDILNFLTWYYTSQASSTGATNPDGSVVNDAAAVLRNNGFHELNSDFANAIFNQYLSPGNGVAIADSSTQADGCTNVAVGGGAN